MNYVIAGYAITTVGLVGYALRVIRRGRALHRSLPEIPEEERPWS